MTNKLPVRYTPMKGVDMTKRLDEIRFPVYASRKWDGVRAYVAQPELILSSSGAEFPQIKAQLTWEKATRKRYWPVTPGVEYEIIHNDETVTAAEINGILKRETYSQAFTDLRFRYIMSYGLVINGLDRTQEFIECRRDLEYYVEHAKDQVWEGVMLRGGDFTYKHGRATAKCQRQMKIKFKKELEAELTDVEYNTVAGRGYEPTLLTWEVLTGPYKGGIITTGCPGDALKQQIIKFPPMTNKSWIAEIEYQGHGSGKMPRQPVFKRWKGED